MSWRNRLTAVADSALRLFAGAPAKRDPYNDPSFIPVGFGGGPTAAGVVVDEKVALQNPTFYRAIALFAETHGRVPYQLMRETAGAGEIDRVPARGEAAYDVLTRRPNAYQTPFTLFCLLGLHKILRGNALAELVRGPDGAVSAIVPLPPESTWIAREREADRWDPRAAPVYRTYGPSGNVRTLFRDEVAHVPMLTRDGRVGVSLLEPARELLGVAAAAARFQGKFFVRGLGQRGVILTKDGFGPKHETELRQDLDKQAQNSHGLLFLRQGIDFKSLMFDPHASQLVEAQQLLAELIARFTGIPLSMLGFSSPGASSYSAVEHLAIQFVELMDPHILGLAQELNRVPFVPGPFTVVANMNALLRADVQTRMKMLDTLWKHRAITRNEGRKLEHFPRREGFDDAPDGVRLAPSKARNAFNARWRAWEGHQAAARARVARERRAETDTSRPRRWVEELAARAARDEERFVASLAAPNDSQVGDWYQAWARRTARALALPDDAMLALAESRAQGVVEAAAGGEWNGKSWARVWRRGLQQELATMALEGIEWLKAA